MNVYRKNTCLAVGAIVLGLMALPVGYSEAQSSNEAFSADMCTEVSDLTWDKMDDGQQLASVQCDMLEAAHDWEQQYGNLDEKELLAGIVNE